MNHTKDLNATSPVVLKHQCNLCKNEFKTRNRYKRFCSSCRFSSTYRFADNWWDLKQVKALKKSPS